MENALKWLGYIVAAIAVMFYRLFVCVKVFGYIGVKLFHLSPITMWQAFAISSLLHVFTADYSAESKSTDLDEAAKKLLRVWLTISLAWLISWLIFG